MAKLSFTVPGTPLAKKRHRTVPMSQCVGCKKMVHGNFHQCPDCGQSLRFIKNVSYSDSESVRYENLVSFCARQEMLKAGIEQPFTKSIKVGMVFFFPIPVSRAKKLKHGDYHSQRPDVDNAAKSILDGLNTVLFTDDCLIGEIQATKVWGNQAQAEVTVEEL